MTSKEELMKKSQMSLAGHASIAKKPSLLPSEPRDMIHYLQLIQLSA